MEEYVAKKSSWSVLSFWRILSMLLIIPIFINVYRIFALKCETITFYEDKIVVRKGIIAKSEKRFSFQGVYSVSVNQTLFGRIFNYGNIQCDFVGVHDLNTSAIKNPQALVQYLETRIVKRGEVNRLMY